MCVCVCDFEEIRWLMFTINLVGDCFIKNEIY